MPVPQSIDQPPNQREADDTNGGGTQVPVEPRVDYPSRRANEHDRTYPASHLPCATIKRYLPRCSVIRRRAQAAGHSTCHRFDRRLALTTWLHHMPTSYRTERNISASVASPHYCSSFPCIGLGTPPVLDAALPFGQRNAKRTAQQKIHRARHRMYITTDSMQRSQVCRYCTMYTTCERPQSPEASTSSARGRTRFPRRQH